MSSTLTSPSKSPTESQLGAWQERLAAIVNMMRDMSRQTDPQEMAHAYGAHVRRLLAPSQFLSLSRRDLSPPAYRITRSSRWAEDINPWKQKDRLPLFYAGVLGELLYGDEPRILNDFTPDPADPAIEYLGGARSLMAIPNYDQGVALNMVVRLSDQPGAFDLATFPDQVWTSNLFGRATQSLVLSEELKRAYQLVDRELHHVAEIQRGLLPKTIPAVPNLTLAAHYQTSRWAGGDYYDFFPLPDDRWGILIADVSGHGTPAAVMMAITHTIAHSYPGHPIPPGSLLEHVNNQLASKYTIDSETFVTAFYGVYDPARRELTFANAGHNPPRIKRCADGSIAAVDGVEGLPLGVFPEIRYSVGTRSLVPGDQLVFYTDGITDATNARGELFGLRRLDEAIRPCRGDADELIAAVLVALDRFTAGEPPIDDQTLVVGKVT